MKQEIKTPLTLSDLLSLHDVVAPFFIEKWDRADRNERRWIKAKSWTAGQETEIKGQDRKPYSFLLVPSKLQTISATQKTARTSFKVESESDPNDEVKAELMQLKIKSVENRSKFKYVESDVFDSGLAVCFGATELYLDYTYGFPQVKVKTRDYKSVTWDTNCRAYDISDPEDGALWVSVIDKIYRYQLEKEYGEKVLEHVTEGDYGSFIGRARNSYYCTPNLNGKNDFDVISKFTMHVRVFRDYHCVIFPDTEGLNGFKETQIFKFRNKKEAEAKLHELQLPYLLAALPEEGSIEKKAEPRLDKYVFTYNKMLEYEETELVMFPENLYFAFFFEGDFISMQDFLESNQLYIDRILSQIDYSFGKSLKSVRTININALPDGTTFEDAQRIADKTGGTIPVRGTEEVFRQYDSQGVPPQYFQLLLLLQSYLEDQAGGRSFQGLAEGKNESGVAVEKKKQSGKLIALNFIDNLSRFKQALGENIMFWIKTFETDEQTLKVEGGALTPEMLQLLQQNKIFTPSNRNDGGGYVKINQEGNPMTFLKDANLELLVTEAELSETDKEMRLISMLQMEKANPALLQSITWTKLKLKYLPLNSGERQALLQEIEGLQKAQAQAAAQEADFKQQELNIKKAQVIASIQPSIQNKPEDKKKEKKK